MNQLLFASPQVRQLEDDLEALQLQLLQSQDAKKSPMHKHHHRQQLCPSALHNTSPGPGVLELSQQKAWMEDDFWSLPATPVDSSFSVLIQSAQDTTPSPQASKTKGAVREGFVESTGHQSECSSPQKHWGAGGRRGSLDADKPWPLRGESTKTTASSPGADVRRESPLASADAVQRQEDSPGGTEETKPDGSWRSRLRRLSMPFSSFRAV